MDNQDFFHALAYPTQVQAITGCNILKRGIRDPNEVGTVLILKSNPGEVSRSHVTSGPAYLTQSHRPDAQSPFRDRTATSRATFKRRYEEDGEQAIRAGPIKIHLRKKLLTKLNSAGTKCEPENLCDPRMWPDLRKILT